MQVEVLAEGLGWPEGPSRLPDGRIVFVETYRSQVSVWDPKSGYGRFADTAGGPNATALGDDGVYVTQNGGVAGPWRAERMCEPSIQRVTLAGTVEVVCTKIEGVMLKAPNDLAFGPDGTLYFTDPGDYDQEIRPDPGYIFALRPDGTGRVIAELERTYPNGIAVESDGSVVWTESYTGAVRRWRPGDGSIEMIGNPRHIPDGLAIASDGRLYVTAVDAAGLDILTPDGGNVEFLSLGSVPTNCLFDGTTMYVTDGGEGGETETAVFGGSLFRIELGVEGMKPFGGRIGA